MAQNKQAKPFLKWAGGKTQLWKDIEANLPSDFNRYYEPFIGAGAVLFNINKIDSVINDVNFELTNCYNTIKNDVEKLIEHLHTHKHESDYFYELRNIDRNKEEFNKLTNVERASRILYMNKTCFNGLYRVNSKGEFNVPFGKYKNPNWINEENLRLVSEFLNRNNVTILNEDFIDAVKDAKKGDFIYLDPPYAPVSKTSSFNTYAKDGFNEQDQIRVRDLMNELTARGCFVMASNSFVPFIEEIYKDFKVLEIKANRFINSNGQKRGKVSEALILNY